MNDTIGAGGRGSVIEPSFYGGVVVRVVGDNEPGGAWLVETGAPGPAGDKSGREMIEIGAGPIAAQVAELLGLWLAVARNWPLVRQPDRDEDGVAAIEPPTTRGEVIVLLRRLRWAWSDPTPNDIDVAGMDPAAVERAIVSALCALTPASDRERRTPVWLDVLADEVTVVIDRLTELGHGRTATEQLTRAAAQQFTLDEQRHLAGTEQ